MAYGNSANNVSSPVSLSKVTQVFDAASTGSMRNYLRGSLPYPVTNAYSSIAASGTLSLASFATANNPPAILPDSAIFLNDFGLGSPASVQLTLSSDGNQYQYAPGLQQTNKWLYAGDRRDYDVQFIQTWKIGPGDAFIGTVNTWLNLVSSRSWSISLDGDRFENASWYGFLEIRMNASPQTVMANCSIQLSADTEL